MAKSREGEEQDYYALLDLEEGCEDKKLIMKAYRSHALIYHPDKNKTPQAAEMFQKLHKAKEVLMDDAAKAAYDAVMATQREKRKRDEMMSLERKKMVESLIQRERERRGGAGSLAQQQQEERAAQRRLEEEIERLRRTGHFDSAAKDFDLTEDKPSVIVIDSDEANKDDVVFAAVDRRRKRNHDEYEKEVLAKMVKVAAERKQQKKETYQHASHIPSDALPTSQSH